MTTRLILPVRSVFDNHKPLLAFHRFGVHLNSRVVARKHFPARRVIAEFMPPHQTIPRKPDSYTVRCAVDGVQFELMRERNEITPVVVHLEKPLNEIEEAMQQLPSVARAMLVFDHRARSGAVEAVTMVGLIDWLAPRANERKLGAMDPTVRDAELALEEVFGAAARWMENGYE